MHNHTLGIHCRLAALEYLAEHIPVALLRITNDRESGQRRSAHRVNIIERIDRRHLAVDNGSSATGVKKSSVCTSAVSSVRRKTPASSGFVKSDDHIFAMLRRKFTQNLSKVARCEFSHSTSAGDHFRQTLLHIYLLLLFSLTTQNAGQDRRPRNTRSRSFRPSFVPGNYLYVCIRKPASALSRPPLHSRP